MAEKSREEELPVGGEGHLAQQAAERRCSGGARHVTSSQAVASTQTHSPGLYHQLIESAESCSMSGTRYGGPKVTINTPFIKYFQNVFIE